LKEKSSAISFGPREVRFTDQEPTEGERGIKRGASVKLAEALIGSRVS
jgi:hypothetical protein